MTRSPLRRLVFSTLRRLLYLWVRSEPISQSSVALTLDSSQPVIYVLQQSSLSDLAVLDHECRKAGLPRPVEPASIGRLQEPASFFYLTMEPDWRGRQDKRGVSPTLARLVAALESGQVEDVQIVPISVFWGQSPASESSPWKLLFADSWAVTGRLRRLLSILILGRKTRIQFAAPIRLRELVDQDKGRERTLRMVQRILRVHFRNQKAAVIEEVAGQLRDADAVLDGLLEEEEEPADVHVLPVRVARRRARGLRAPRRGPGDRTAAPAGSLTMSDAQAVADMAATRAASCSGRSLAMERPSVEAIMTPETSGTDSRMVRMMSPSITCMW